MRHVGDKVDSHLFSELNLCHVIEDPKCTRDFPLGVAQGNDARQERAPELVLAEKLQLVAKQEAFDPVDHFDQDETDTSTLGINYYFKGHDLKVMLDYLRVDIGRLESQDKVLARLQVVF